MLTACIRQKHYRKFAPLTYVTHQLIGVCLPLKWELRVLTSSLSHQLRYRVTVTVQVDLSDSVIVDQSCVLECEAL
jgi:hypothetical protein